MEAMDHFLAGLVPFTRSDALHKDLLCRSWAARWARSSSQSGSGPGGQGQNGSVHVTWACKERLKDTYTKPN